MSLPDWREEPIAKKHDPVLAATAVGGVAILINAKSEQAALWYSSCGAIPLADAPLSLLLPLASVRDALVAAAKL